MDEFNKKKMAVELETYILAFEFACRELEARERKTSADVFEKELLKTARIQKRRKENEEEN